MIITQKAFPGHSDVLATMEKRRVGEQMAVRDRWKQSKVDAVFLYLLCVVFSSSGSCIELLDEEVGDCAIHDSRVKLK